MGTTTTDSIGPAGHRRLGKPQRLLSGPTSITSDVDVIALPRASFRETGAATIMDSRSFGVVGRYTRGPGSASH